MVPARAGWPQSTNTRSAERAHEITHIASHRNDFLPVNMKKKTYGDSYAKAKPQSCRDRVPKNG